jgi:septal ring factor EnvC (AmiA/AmiB activator)
MKFRNKIFSLIAACAFAFALPVLAVDLSADPETIESQREQWTQRIRSNSDAVANAQARVYQAQAEYTSMRAHNKGRGDRRVQAKTRLQSAEKALADAEAALAATLDAARAASVPPGWIRDATSGQPAAPAAPADSND